MHCSLYRIYLLEIHNVLALFPPPQIHSLHHHLSFSHGEIIEFLYISKNNCFVCTSLLYYLSQYHKIFVSIRFVNPLLIDFRHFMNKMFSLFYSSDLYYLVT